VLYVLDATRPPRTCPRGSDCNGDGAHSLADDLNTDGSVGDVLDCEIGAVKKLNTTPDLVALPAPTWWSASRPSLPVRQGSPALNTTDTALFGRAGLHGGR
jgi:hypothetical protein